jgi:phage gpG-like protein
MGDWRVIQDLAAGEAMVAEVRTRLTSTGAEKIAAEASAAMLEEARSAFQTKRDPRTGAAWAPPAESSLRDKRYRSLLVRTGQLEGDLAAGYKVNPGGATAFINVQATSIRKAMINLYGVEAKARRTYIRNLPGGRTRKESRQRKNVNEAIPARRFVGLSDARVSTIITDAEKIITEGLP